MKSLNRLIDRLSEFIAARKGLLPLIGLFLIFLNLVFQFLSAGWIVQSNLLLHFGVLIAIFGLMLAKAL